MELEHCKWKKLETITGKQVISVGNANSGDRSIPTENSNLEGQCRADVSHENTEHEEQQTANQMIGVQDSYSQVMLLLIMKQAQDKINQLKITTQEIGNYARKEILTENKAPNISENKVLFP